MRFALIATSAAAALAVPMAVGAAGPQMSPDQFLASVRCAAYEDLAGADIGAQRLRLNAEALRQAPEVAARAREEVRAIARQAVNAASAGAYATSGADLAACASDMLIANVARVAV